jgi:hypothetical protein
VFAGTAALLLAVSAAMDFDHDAALFTVVYCCGVALLQVPLRASMPVRQQRSRYMLRAGWPLAALLIAVAGWFTCAEA